MNQLIARFSDLIKGSITGFDRIVFKGFILPLRVAKGAMNFCRSKNILNNWTMWQSEWASDLIFSSPEGLPSIRDSLLRHAHMIGTITRLLRYMDRPVTNAGKPYARSKDEVITRFTDFNDGVRVRHWVDQNSVKVYNEQNVRRVATTINNPNRCKVFRHKQGQKTEESKSRLPLRKGVMDIPLRAKVSQEVNERFMNDLSAFHDETPVRDILEKITCHQIQKGGRFRGLEPTGKDRDMLQLICDPEYRISGITNKMIRQKSSNIEFGRGKRDKQLSSKISRYFRLLRAHGIIKKLPKQNRYMLTKRGGQLTNLLNAFLAASTEKLMKLAA